MTARFATLVLALGIAACNSTPVASQGIGVSVTGYDRSCATVADCVPVATDSVGCCEFQCPHVALGADAAATYLTKRAEAKVKACPVSPPICPRRACPPERIACTSGLCEVLDPDGGADDTSAD